MGINNMPLTMAICLLLTIIIESIFAFLLGVRSKKDFLNITLVNVLTNPIVVTIPYLIYILYGYKFYTYSIILLEIFTFLIEGLIYLKVLDYKKINPLFLSLLLNLTSYGLGLLMEGVFNL